MIDVELSRAELELIKDLAKTAIRQRLFPDNSLYELEKYMDQMLEELEDMEGEKVV